METIDKKSITVEALINAPVDKVWKFWTLPRHIMQWNNANDEWHTPRAENDLRVGGKFCSRMEAKDGSMGFDFEGEYLQLIPQKLIEYRIADGRNVNITFEEEAGKTRVTETFEAENTHSLELQQGGWQAILNNFKNYTESTRDIDTLQFNVTINAPVEKVYHSMLDEELYKAWTAPFNANSHYIGSWEKGSKIIFIGCDDKGTMGGMVSRIQENIPYKFVSIEHLGLYKNGSEITTGPEVEAWAGAQENYSFKDIDGKTLVSIDMDSNPQFEEYFKATWPKALDKLKELCEA